MATIHASVEHISGIPLGGIGAGSVEIRPDGYFHEWEIFNSGSWSPQQPECCKSVGTPAMPPGALAFHLWVRQGGRAPLVRHLGLRGELPNPQWMPWHKNVEGIEYEGRFPVARLRYIDRKLPVQVSATMFSPFVPHESRTSGTPGFHAAFRIRNTSDEPVEVSVMGMLRDPIAYTAEQRRLAHRIVQEGASTLLVMGSGLEEKRPDCGTMAMAVRGGENTFMAGEYEEITRGLITWPARDIDALYNMEWEYWPTYFRDTGRLCNSEGGTCPTDLLPKTDAEIEALTPERKRELLEGLLRYPFAKTFAERLRQVDAGVLDSVEGVTRFLRELRQRISTFSNLWGQKRQWGDGALCSTVTLAPMEEKEIVFAVGWHFPWHYAKSGAVMGHVYENWFADALEVTRYLAREYPRQREAVERFAGTLFETTLDVEFPEAWTGQLSTLLKSSWWTKDGRFAVWEGEGCCGLHTTDITYDGSFPLIALFPDLQLGQMRMGAEYQLVSGQVHHMFTPDLHTVDESGYKRVDMNPQFVLLVCRDYLWTADRQYLEWLWPKIELAMAFTESLDGDGDGLPDRNTRHNTYDLWSFFGTPSFIASLWLGALRAGAYLARQLGRIAQAERWEATLAKATPAFDRKLWNGEYYSLWVDGAQRDEICMTDQLDGEWYTSLIGLGHALPRERVIAALKAIVRYNYQEDVGLNNATYPPGAVKRLPTFNNVQAIGIFSGIEYLLASMLLDFGLVAEAGKLVRTIDERYRRNGRIWNHLECGDHYYRAMCSWALLLAASGFKIDLPRRVLRIEPKVSGEPLRAPWFTSTAWGVLVQWAGKLRVECRGGEMELARLETTFGEKGRVMLDGEPVAARGQEGGLALERAVKMRAGQVLEVCACGD